MPKTGLRSRFLAFLHCADVPGSEVGSREWQEQVQTPAARQGRSFSSLGRKKEESSSEKDYVFHILTLPETYFAKFVSSVQNLKLITSTGGNHNPLSVEVPAGL